MGFYDYLTISIDSNYIHVSMNCLKGNKYRKLSFAIKSSLTLNGTRSHGLDCGEKRVEFMGASFRPAFHTGPVSEPQWYRTRTGSGNENTSKSKTMKCDPQIVLYSVC